MAYEIDTATDYLDLLARIETFAGNQGWTVHRSTYDAAAGTDGELILEGPGLSGNEAIVVGLRSYSDSGNDRWNFALRGFTSYDGSAWDSLPGASPEVYVPLWSSSIPYWLMVNGQRILLMAKVSTYYMHAYLGFVSTYSTASEYPYPLFIGGTSNSESENYTSISVHQAYWNYPDADSHGQWWRPDNQWWGINSDYDDGPRLFPWYEVHAVVSGVREGIGTHVLLPAILMDASSNQTVRGVVGELDGLFWVSGFGAGVEDTVTVGTQDYVVGQDVQRAEDNDHCALELA